MFYSIPLTANVEYVLPVPGRLFLLDSTGAADTVQVKFLKNSAADKIVPGRKKAFKAIVEFDSVALLTTVNATVSFFVSFNEVDIGLDDGVHMFIDNEDTAPVPVKTPAGQPLEVLFAGTVDPVLGVVTVDNTDAEAIPIRSQALTTFVHGAPVSVGVAATSLGAADATVRKIIIRNAHETAKVAIGGAGVTLANAAILLEPGDIWDERDAAGAEWFGISDTAATDVSVMRVKS